MKVCFETFGCRLNRAEALQEEADYAADGWETTQSHADADLIVVRGCSVTRRAQEDCEKTIAHLKRKYPLKKIKVCGCLKTSALPGAGPIAPRPAAPDAAIATGGAVPTRTARAYLKVQDGCAGKCAFCIVPKFRGPSRSADFDGLLAKARAFIGAGYHEIVVTGCNLALYASSGRRLPELVAALAELDPACRIRLGSVEPSPVAADVVQAMAEHANVCRFLHIPVQSGSNRVLVAMRRPYFVKDVEDLVRAARARMPDIAVGCDLMSGFPDELELDHFATRGLLSRLAFARAHVFPFSERPGTVAASLPGQIPPAIRKSRAHDLSKLADDSRSAFAKRFIGKTAEVLVEDESTCSGWTGEYLWCTCPHARAPRKSILRVRITGAKGHVLTGEPR